jgi:hypothetical protein
METEASELRQEGVGIGIICKQRAFNLIAVLAIWTKGQ